jgi:hypothetical protein
MNVCRDVIRNENNAGRQRLAQKRCGTLPCSTSARRMRPYAALRRWATTKSAVRRTTAKPAPTSAGVAVEPTSVCAVAANEPALQTAFHCCLFAIWYGCVR